MSRRGAERDGTERALSQEDRPSVPARQTGRTLEREPWTGADEQRATAVPGREQERAERNARLADWGAAWRRVHPTVPEQQMLGILASLGERAGVDFVREYKIAPGVYADVAFPALGRVIVRWNLRNCQGWRQTCWRIEQRRLCVSGTAINNHWC